MNIPVATEVDENVRYGVKCCGWGFVVVVFFVVLGLIITVTTKNNEEFNTLSLQPMLYKKAMYSIPGNCAPYTGCLYPYVNPENGKQCEKAWRDCGAYQDCVSGWCQHKKVF